MASPAAAEIVLSHSPARGVEAKNKAPGKLVNEAVDVKLANLRQSYLDETRTKYRVTN